MMSAILLSIKPEYAKAILEGKKGYEFRKVRCKAGVNKIVFYATVPWSKVVGEAEIEGVLEGNPSDIWEQTKDAAGITRDKYDKYYHGHDRAVAYKLRNAIAYDPPRNLSDYGIDHVPQSFIYLR